MLESSSAAWWSKIEVKKEQPWWQNVKIDKKEPANIKVEAPEKSLTVRPDLQLTDLEAPIVKARRLEQKQAGPIPKVEQKKYADRINKKSSSRRFKNAEASTPTIVEICPESAGIDTQKNTVKRGRRSTAGNAWSQGQNIIF